MDNLLLVRYITYTLIYSLLIAFILKDIKLYIKNQDTKLGTILIKILTYISISVGFIISITVITSLHLSDGVTGLIGACIVMIGVSSCLTFFTTL